MYVPKLPSSFPLMPLSSYDSWIVLIQYSAKRPVSREITPKQTPAALLSAIFSDHSMLISPAQVMTGCNVAASVSQDVEYSVLHSAHSKDMSAGLSAGSLVCGAL